MIAREGGVPFLLDACQSVGQLDIDVDHLQCDFLTVTGRKFLRGPRGSGFMYVRRSMLESTSPPMVDMHGARWVEPGRYELVSSARRYENWEFNHAATLGLGKAVDEALAWGLADIEQRVVGLAADLRSRLRDSGFDVYDIGRRLSALVTTAVPGLGAGVVQDRLFEEGINVSITSPSSTRIDAERRDLPDLIRLSPHYFNTEEELESVVRALSRLRP
jgi:selenocysteine lyase/cysteine desulfurase